MTLIHGLMTLTISSRQQLYATWIYHERATAYLVKKWQDILDHHHRLLLYHPCSSDWCWCSTHGLTSTLIGILIKDELWRVIHEVCLAWTKDTRTNLWWSIYLLRSWIKVISFLYQKKSKEDTIKLLLKMAWWRIRVYMQSSLYRGKFLTPCKYVARVSFHVFTK